MNSGGRFRPRIVLALAAVLGGTGFGIYGALPLFKDLPGGKGNASAAVAPDEAAGAPVGTSGAGASGVGALGRIEPGSRIIDVSVGTPDRLETLRVKRGDFVQKDELLGTLQGYAVAVADRDRIQALIDEAQRRLAAERALGQARIDAAELALQSIEQITPLKIAAQKATVAKLQVTLANDKDILTARLELARTNSGTRRSLDDQRTQVVGGEALLNVARAQLAELERKFELDRRDAQIQIQNARATRDKALAEIPLDSLKRELVLAQTKADRMTVTAPTAGTILNVMIRPGEQVGQQSGEPVLKMGDVRVMHVVAEVYETDIPSVAPGAVVTVTGRALPRPLKGRVVEIGSMIHKNDVLNTDPAARVDARVVEVRAEFDDPAAVAQLTNMTVDVVIAAAASNQATNSQSGRAARP